MPIAAVPNYLGKNFKEASPGMRFGMYLQLWGTNRDNQTVLWQTYDVVTETRGNPPSPREIKYENKVTALNEAKRLNPNDSKIMINLLVRQQATFDAIATETNSLRIDALATAPFTTGLGNEHPLENGFAFLNPYGLPYLPGSGIKGVLRQAAGELANGMWGDTQHWDHEAIAVLFGHEATKADAENLRGALMFWDVIPQIAGDSLMVEIMTPHQSHYYQHKNEQGSAAPHESGKPTPLNFLTVPTQSRFIFFMQCDLTHLQGLAPALAQNGAWKKLLEAAFVHAFEWLGFGAKTAVGYGAMKENPQARAEREQKETEIKNAAQREADELRRQALSPEDRAWEEHQADLDQFKAQFELARKSAYKPGSIFDSHRNEFVKAVLIWEDVRSRQAAGILLKETMTKNWGIPGNKETKQRLQVALTNLSEMPKL